MNKIQLLLTILAEECNETGHRASKAIRFTPEECEPNQQMSNAERIVYEFSDIVAVMELLKEEGVINNIIDQNAVANKKEKIKKWMEYSIQLGTVKP